MISLAILLLGFSWAQSDKEVTFRDKVHVSVKGYQADRSPSVTEIKCNAYSESQSAGVKAKLKSSQGLSYALECIASEVGNQVNLLVFKKDKQIARLTDIASQGSDCGYSAETQAWLVDLNGDKSMDVIERTKTKNVPSDCADKGKASAEDFVTVFFWDNEKMEHSKAKLDDKDLKKFKKKYDFTWRAY